MVITPDLIYFNLTIQLMYTYSYSYTNSFIAIANSVIIKLLFSTTEQLQLVGGTEDIANPQTYSQLAS